MATLTIRNLSDDLVERLKKTAARQGRSMEQEVRLLLQRRYAERSELLEKIRDRWDLASAPTGDEVQQWLRIGWE